VEYPGGLLMHQLALFGATGRMGRSLLQALGKAPAAFRLSGALASAESTSLGEELSVAGVPTGVRVTADVETALAGADVAVDFSLATAVVVHAEACAAAGVGLVLGATGLDAATLALIERAAHRIPIVLAPNTSVGVNLMARLAALAAGSLGIEYDIEISEAHHRMKRDAPSGTALALGEAVARARGVDLDRAGVMARHGTSSPRAPGSIGFSVVRGGDIVGEHTVLFAGDGERLEITHRATDREGFARGALRAAGWLIGRPAGLYRMSDVLGL
jgi:4-hydroxy-tetrahydrodipicolinate reductase